MRPDWCCVARVPFRWNEGAKAVLDGDPTHENMAQKEYKARSNKHMMFQYSLVWLGILKRTEELD